MSTPSTTIGSTFYCRQCAEAHGMLAGLHLTSSSPSEYQVQKALKHLGPVSTVRGVNSVLNSSSTGDLDHYSRLALEQGFLEVEPNGCRTLVYQAPHDIGTQFQSTQPTLLLDSFRWVLSTSFLR